MPKPPKILLVLSLLVGLGMLGASGVRLVQALGASPVNWLVIGLEAVIAVAGVFTILTGLGRFRDGPAITLGFAGAAVLVCSVLSLSVLTSRTFLRGYFNDPVSLAALGLALGAAGLAACIVLARHPKDSLRAMLIGAVLGALAIGFAAPFVSTGLRARFTSLNPIIVTIGAMLGAVIVIGLLSAAGHYLIRAFEIGRDPAVVRAFRAAYKPASGSKK